MLFKATEEPTHLQPDPEKHPYSGLFVNVLCGPESIVTYGGSVTRKQLELVTAAGTSRLTYEETLLLKAWLNEHVQ